MNLKSINMNFKIISFLCLALSTDVLGKQLKIIGGVDVDIREVPYLVAIKRIDQEEIFCTGSIISHKHIITAAHCIKPREMPELRAQTGSTTGKDNEGITYEIEWIQLHPKFITYPKKSNRHVYDVAILRVRGQIIFNQYQNKVQLPTEDIQAGFKTYLIAGWGSVSFPGYKAPKKLQKTWMQVLDNKVCELSHQFEIKDNQLCAFQSKGVGVCSGDSGAPLVSNGVLIGLASFGIPCGKGKSDIYTRIYRHMDFIRIIVPEGIY